MLYNVQNCGRVDSCDSKASLCEIIPQIVCLCTIRRVRAGAARQGVVAVLEDGLGHLAAPLDRAVQALVSEIRMRLTVDSRGR